MGLIDRFVSWLNEDSRNAVIPAWLPGQDNLWPYANLGGNMYPLNLNLTVPRSPEEEIENDFGSYVGQAYKSNGVVFACMLARLMVFSEARFQFRALRKGRPGDLFGTPALDILEHPFGPNSTTGDLLARAISDVDLAGNFYATRRKDRIIRFRPDWVTMVHGSPSGDPNAGDAEFLGIVYHPGGEHSPTGSPEYVQRSELCHFAPIPDPTARSRGMSWITPIVREVMSDKASTSHKLRFLESGATPALAFKRTDSLTKEAFDTWVGLIKSGHQGTANAYRSYFLDAGADVTTVGADLVQADLKITQGAGETRIAAAAGIHPVVVGLSEGMQGASLNAGNFNSARRLTADKTFRPLWRNMAGSLQTLVPPPSGSQLWYDDRDIAFLREDRKDASEIQGNQASTMQKLLSSGWEPDSIVKAVDAEDWSLLKHSGLYSVQLQPPGTKTPDPTAPIEAVPSKPTNGTKPTKPAAKPSPTGGAS
jgi:phage portal protein BeeE